MNHNSYSCSFKRAVRIRCGKFPAGRRHFASKIGTEELGHLEMVGTIVYQLTRNLTPEQIKAAGYDAYFVNHTTGIYPQNASGEPFNADTLASTGDSLADIHEDLAAEQKARMTYDNILRYCGDEPDVRDAIRFLRAREVVHYQRFGEAMLTRGRRRDVAGNGRIPAKLRKKCLRWLPRAVRGGKMEAKIRTNGRTEGCT